MGMDDDAVVKESLKSISKMEEPGGFQMPLGDYMTFWEALNKETGTKWAYDFLHQLIETLMLVEKKALANKAKETKVKAKIFGKHLM
jgi:hypothetical protein